VFRDAAQETGLEPELLDDCVLMASELAANTLHARAVAGAGGGGDQLAPVTQDLGGVLFSPPSPPPRPSVLPELWLYLRGLGIRRELVCKVFDGCRGWRHGCAPSASLVSAQAVAGRGLQIVHELSRGRWGHHPTRARLGGRHHGKAVWFAVPAPLAHARLVDVTGLRAYTLSADVTAARANERLSARQAAMELQAMLNDRGVPGRLVRADRPASDTSVLSVCHGLTVWCRGGVVSLTTPESSERWNYADLVEAAELTVQRYEELDLGASMGVDLAAAQ
jgi:hypothetical protein